MRDDIKSLIATSLKELRHDHKLTQNDLSNICKVDTSTIVRYERNNVIMQIDTIIKILSAYDVDIFNFFEKIIAKTQK